MVQFGSGSERIQPKRPLGVPDGWRGKVQPGCGGSTPTHHPTATLQPGAGTAVHAASTGQRCSSHRWSLPWRGPRWLHGFSEGYPTQGSWQITLHRGDRSLGGSRGTSYHKVPLAIPIHLRHPQASSPGPGPWTCGQIPFMAGGDRTAPWPSQPAAPAKRQELGTSARATCLPVCSPGCWGHPGVPLAAGCGQSPGEREEAARQLVLSDALAEVKVPCAPPGEPRGVPGRREQPPHCCCPWGWRDWCGGAAQEGPVARPAQGVPELSAPLCQHPVGPGALRPPLPVAPPIQRCSPSTRCPWPGLAVPSPCAVEGTGWLWLGKEQAAAPAAALVN